MAYQNVKVKERQTVSQSSQTKQLGIVSEVPMNEWNAAITYEKLNLVTYKNSTFIAKRQNTNIPPLDAANWQEAWMQLQAGIAVSGTMVEYASSDISATSPPTDGWSATIPELDPRTLIWTRLTIEFTDSTRTVLYSVGVAATATKTSELINDGDGSSPFATEKELENETARAEGVENGLDARVKTIESEIPTQASAENQLADKAFVNSSINALAAFFITPTATGDKAFATRAALLAATTFYSGGKERVPTQNDYAIVLADESQEKGVDGTYPTTRYSYQGGTYPNGQWDFQYIVNNTSLTQAQVDALNSGITAGAVGQITTNKNDIAAENARAKAAEKVNADAAAAAQTTANGKYTKPSGGIPASDLAGDIPTSKITGLGSLAAKSTITNADVASDAAIAQSKISGLVSAFNNFATNTRVDEVNKTAGDAKSIADEAYTKATNAIEGSQKGRPTGVATLDGDGNVPWTQLDKYVALVELLASRQPLARGDISISKANYYEAYDEFRFVCQESPSGTWTERTLLATELRTIKDAGELFVVNMSDGNETRFFYIAFYNNRIGIGDGTFNNIVSMKFYGVKYGITNK